MLRLAPDLAHAALALAAILVDAGRPTRPKPRRAAGLDGGEGQRLKAQLYLQLAQALRRQRKDSEALAALEMRRPSMRRCPAWRATAPKRFRT